MAIVLLCRVKIGGLHKKFCLRDAVVAVVVAAGGGILCKADVSVRALVAVN